MSDPVNAVTTKTTNARAKAQESPMDAQSPDTAAEVEHQTLAVNQAMNLRRARKGEPTVVLPGGQRRSAVPL